jgi:hypothetical protein
MINPITLVKEHPVITIGGVVGVVVIVLMLNNAGGAPADTGASYASYNDPTATANAQMAAMSLQVNAAKEVELNKNATALSIAQLSAAQADAERLSNQALRERELQSQETLGALSIGANKEIQLAGLSTQERVAASMSDIQKTALNAQQETARIMANAQIEQARIASQPKGLFSWLFG